MRDHHQCPKCQHHEILKGPAPYEMALGGLRSAWTGGVDGPLEAYLCLHCGFMEFYLKAGEAFDPATWKGPQPHTKPDPAR
jgi:hypothetical protein